MAHPLVDQLRFTRHEWLRGLEGVTEEEGSKHFASMNCISWMVGHLAWQEQRYWLDRAQGKQPFPQVQQLFAYGAPMCTPSLAETQGYWNQITQESEAFLDSLTTERLQEDLMFNGEPTGQSIGSAMRRMTYHYWFHLGEIQAIRQMLGHTNLPGYVGDLEEIAPYRPE